MRDVFINTIKIGYKQQILGFELMPEYRSFFLSWKRI